MAPWLAVEIAWRSLARHRMRAVLASAGIVAGVPSLVAMLALGRGVQNEVDGALRAIGSNVLLVISASAVVSGARPGTGTTQNLTEADAAAMSFGLDEVEHAAPIMRAWTQVIAAHRNWWTMVSGTTRDYFELRDWPVTHGRSFHDDELASAGKVVLLGRVAARELFGPDLPYESMIGETVRVRRVPLVVVGVLGPKGQSAGGDDVDNAAFVPLTTARNRLFGAVQGKPGRVHTIMARVRDEVPMTRGIESIRELLRERHRLGPERADTFVIRDLSEPALARREAGRALSVLLAVIASVGLFVGGVGILNVMLVSLAERTREIGLRLAVGARGRDILAQFLAESVTLALAGGAVGLALGMLAAVGAGREFGWPAELDASDALLALVMAVSVGIAAGLYPAVRASRLQPVDALRHE